MSDLEEDEILLAWLAGNLDTASSEEKRAAFRRLHREFGHTQRGLARHLGLNVSAVNYWTATDEQLNCRRAGKRMAGERRVGGTAVVRVADSWQERASRGLSPAEALELLDEFRALVSPQTQANREAA